jgi:dnd system-associated protein 4
VRNVRRAEAFEPLFKRFTDTPHPVSGRPIFPTQREFLSFLAVLGFNTGERRPLEGKSIELDSRVFDSNEQSKDVIYLIALAGSKDANILLPEREDDAVSIFEEYANSGMRELDFWMKERPDDHIGDQAILSAIRRKNYLVSAEPSIERILNEVEF